MAVRRGTSNANVRGSSEDRRKRREWLVETYRADIDAIRVEWLHGAVTVQYELGAQLEDYTEFLSVTKAEFVPTCRCYRCGVRMTVDEVTVDRIIPGCKGGTYRRNNIRPACGACNSETGGALAHCPKSSRRKAA